MYFTPVNRDGDTLGVWHFDGQIAVRVGVSQPLDSENSHVTVGRGEDLFDAMKNKLAAWYKHGAPCRHEVMKLAPGEYYPRIARPSDQHPHDAPGTCPTSSIVYSSEISTSCGQLVSLIRHLESICQTIEPAPATAKAYGHEIRNLLILTSTEVEAQWRAVLIANDLERARYSTKEYALLNTAMKLNEYKITLNHYPSLQAVSPFSNWDTKAPTRSLKWYHAYNQVKHDRQDCFHLATLENAINAVAAVFILLSAQFGDRQLRRQRSEIGSFFTIVDGPRWPPNEVYTHPYCPSSEHLALIAA